MTANKISQFKAVYFTWNTLKKENFSDKKENISQEEKKI